MLEQRIQQQFFDSADLHNECAHTLARPIVDAAQALLNTVTGGGRLFLCGAGAAHCVAVHAHRVLVGHLDRQRPPLAAVLLQAPVEFATAQLSALAQPGDALVIFDDPADREPELAAACVPAAHACEAHVVWIGAGGPNMGRAGLLETDVGVSLPQARSPKVLELQLLALHAICDALDMQLLGEQEES